MRHQKHGNTNPFTAFHTSLGPIANGGRPANGGMLFRWLLAAMLAICCFTARADDQIRAVRLSNVVGDVQILRGTETEFSQAYPNMPVVQGSTLKTGEDGRAEVQFEDGGVVRLTPNSSAAFSVLDRSSEGRLKTEIDLLTGLSYLELSGPAKQTVVVHFGLNEVTTVARARFRVNLDANPVEIAVLDGTAHVVGGTAYAVDVRANETLRFDANDASRYFLAQGIDGDSWEQWNADREQALGQMAAQETLEARNSGNSGDPAWNDLDYYGNWYSAPGGGTVWAPSGAGAGWDPYGSGYWGYYGNGGGYVWISGYPWGWLPYRCGSWNYYNAFGWGWMPGQCANGFSSYTGVGSGPSWYKPPVRPGHPLGHLPGTRPVIRVDRGLQATKLDFKAIAAPRTVAINGQEGHLLAKTSNPSRPVASGFAPTGPAGRLAYGSVPVYRPASPVENGYRPSGPSSFVSRPSGGGFAPSAHVPSASSGATSASTAHASSGAPSAPAASSGSAAASSGGGHVK